MTERNRPHRFSEAIRRLLTDKTNLLFYARERAGANDLIESARTFAKAGRMEEEIATRLEADGYPREAMMSWVSAASCYLMAHDFAEALRICESVTEKPFVECYRDVLQEIQTDCEKRMAMPILLTDNSEHPDSSTHSTP